MIIRRKLAVLEEKFEMLLFRCISKTSYNSEDKNTMKKSFLTLQLSTDD